MRAIANEQVLVDLNPQSAQPVDFGDQRHRIDNNAVSNHADFTAPEDSGRDQMQNVFHAAMNDSVPSIVTALAADNDVGLGSKHIDDLAFALIAPLHSDQNCVWHLKLETGKKFPSTLLARCWACLQIIGYRDGCATNFARCRSLSLALTHALGFETGSQEEHEQEYEKELKRLRRRSLSFCLGSRTRLLPSRFNHGRPNRAGWLRLCRRSRTWPARSACWLSARLRCYRRSSSSRDAGSFRGCRSL